MSQEGLQESTLAAAIVSEDIAAKDAALGLLLLQVCLLLSGHCGTNQQGAFLKTHVSCQQQSSEMRSSGAVMPLTCDSFCLRLLLSND